jgi:hypothetical protein
VLAFQFAFALKTIRARKGDVNRSLTKHRVGDSRRKLAIGTIGPDHAQSPEFSAYQTRESIALTIWPVISLLLFTEPGVIFWLMEAAPLHRRVASRGTWKDLCILGRFSKASYRRKKKVCNKNDSTQISTPRRGQAGRRKRMGLFSSSETGCFL